MKTTLDEKSIQEQFDSECIKLVMKKLYPEHLGEEKYAIVTALTPDEFREKYAVLFPIAREYVLMTPPMYEPINKSDRNDYKCAKADYRHGVPMEYDETIQTSSTQAPDVAEEYEKKEQVKTMFRLMKNLSKTQQERIDKHFFHGMKLSQIAKQDGVACKNVKRSIDSGLIRLRKMMLKAEQEGVIE